MHGAIFSGKLIVDGESFRELGKKPTVHNSIRSRMTPFPVFVPLYRFVMFVFGFCVLDYIRHIITIKRVNTTYYINQKSKYNIL